MSAGKGENLRRKDFWGRCDTFWNKNIGPSYSTNCTPRIRKTLEAKLANFEAILRIFKDAQKYSDKNFNFVFIVWRGILSLQHG